MKMKRNLVSASVNGYGHDKWNPRISVKSVYAHVVANGLWKGMKSFPSIWCLDKCLITGLSWWPRKDSVKTSLDKPSPQSDKFTATNHVITFIQGIQRLFSDLISRTSLRR